MATASPPPSLLLLPAPPLPSSKPALNAAYRAPLTAVLTRLAADLDSSSSSSSASASPSASASAPSTLVIAIACPVLHGPSPRRKSLRWHPTQSLLAALYTLLSTICAAHAIPLAHGDTANPASIDPRVLLVDHAPRRRYERSPDGGASYPTNRTVVYDLACFAAEVRHPWKAVFHPSSEAGYELLAAYLDLAEGRQALLQSQIVAVEGGLSLSADPRPLADTISADGSSADGSGADLTPGFRVVCLGGTFDHLHAGHKLLLHAAALLLDVPVPDEGRTAGPQAVLIIGLSDDELLRKKKFTEELQPWSLRADAVLAFLATVFNGPFSPVTPESHETPESRETPGITETQQTLGTQEAHDEHGTQQSHDERRVTFRNGAVLVRLAVLRDPYGPTTAEQHVDALVLSGETRGGGIAINDRRREKGWRAMEVYEIDVLDAGGVMDDEGEGGGEGKRRAARDSFADKISSTAIRQQIAERRAREKT